MVVIWMNKHFYTFFKLGFDLRYFAWIKRQLLHILVLHGLVFVVKSFIVDGGGLIKRNPFKIKA